MDNNGRRMICYMYSLGRTPTDREWEDFSNKTGINMVTINRHIRYGYNGEWAHLLQAGVYPFDPSIPLEEALVRYKKVKEEDGQRNANIKRAEAMIRDGLRELNKYRVKTPRARKRIMRLIKSWLDSE
jgi:hypothetical protein